MLARQEDSIVAKHRNNVIFYSKLNYFRYLIDEWKDWEKAYSMNVKGKTVLDVGAGCGETALFFFFRGANRVICIERDKSLFQYLIRNKIANNWNMEIIMEPFSLEHLKLPFDCAKIDIEGAEEALLQLDKIDFPLCLEIHSKDLEKAFGKMGFKTVRRMKTKDVAIMQN